MKPLPVRILVASLAVLLLTAPGRSDDLKDGPLTRKELDARINSALREAINVGADLFNAGDERGCVRVYQGALVVALPFLDHRPDVRKSIEAKISRVRATTSPSDAAFLLRECLDEIRLATRGEQQQPAPARRPKTLWDQLGGEAAVRAVVKDLVTAAIADPKVNFTRNGKYTPDVAALEQKLVELVSAKTGGPLKYSGKSMLEVHKGMGITNDEFAALARHLVAVLEKHKVPKAETDELLAIIAATKKDIVEK
jgi:hemoglobin